MGILYALVRRIRVKKNIEKKVIRKQIGFLTISTTSIFIGDVIFRALCLIGGHVINSSVIEE